MVVFFLFKREWMQYHDNIVYLVDILYSIFTHFLKISYQIRIVLKYEL